MSRNQYETGLAIGCLSNICTEELARDLAPDIVGLLSSTRPYIRKKALSVLYRIFVKFPDALRPSFSRIKEKLEDQDSSVVRAAVNIICELARKNPKNYIPLAPTLWKILTSSQNNWVLIKIIKLFSVLAPLEPRLAKKLVEPLTTILEAPAMALLYECIQCCISGLSHIENIMRTCSAKLRIFIEHPDQNLKYLGLISMGNIMKTYPKGVIEHRDIILTCLEDADTTIRLRALDLISGMVNKKNLQTIVHKLVEYLNLATGQYREDLLENIVRICSQQNYKYIVDFEWYLGILIDLTYARDSKHGKLICDQILDVCVRVESIRPFAVDAMVTLLRDPRLLSDSIQDGGMCEVLSSAAWIVGEYSDLTEDHLPALESLLHTRVNFLPLGVQVVYVQNILKLFSRIAYNASNSNNFEHVEAALSLINERLGIYLQSQHLEVQERACFLNIAIDIYKKERANGNDISTEFAVLFEDPLKPVSPLAQSKVPIPEGLDLDAWINEPYGNEPSPWEVQESQETGWADIQDPFVSHSTGISSMGIGYGSSYIGDLNKGSYNSGYSNNREVDPLELEKKRAQMASMRANDPYYLGGKGLDRSMSRDGMPPIETLTREDLALNDGLGFRFSPSSRKKDKSKKKKDKKKRVKAEVLATEELPEGVTLEPNEIAKKDVKDKLAEIQLDDILPSETLPVRQHRQVESPTPTRTVEKSSQTSPMPQPTFTLPTSNGRPKVATKKDKKEKKRLKKELKKLSKVTMYRDENIRVSFKWEEPTEDTIRLPILLKNVSKTPVCNVDLDLEENDSIQWVRPEDAPQTGPISLNVTLQPNEKTKYGVPLRYTSCLNPIQVTGKLRYTLQGNEESKEESIQFTVPCHLFLKGVDMSQTAFVELLKGPLSASLKTTALSNTITNVVFMLSSLFKLSIIDNGETRGSLYGITTQGHHVAILVKTEAEKVALAVKSSDDVLASNLIQEIQTILK